ncbi:MAG: 3-hydroxyacyl-CoA dehydrogenase [Candidatus Magnetomorum sp.]|nr:3-hydroxyacyl-CoA dehydrogenase [Candidatus Magnetomorum sp.]
MKLEDIKKILIVGSGTMGQQIALLFAINGYDVVMNDISDDILNKAFERLKKFAGNLERSNQYSKDVLDLAIQRIRLISDPETAAKDVDLISESVPEDPELKGKVFRMFHDFCPPETLFTTNTSSLIPSMFAESTGRPERLCALHFHDITITKVVDIMPHPGTASDIVNVLKELLEKMGQIPIMMDKEHHGYLFNNMLMAFLASALTLAQKGVAPIAEIDKAWTGIMHTFSGPFGIMDVIGLDTVWKICDYWASSRNDKQAIANANFLKTYVDAGKTGVKTGEGFYGYK